MSNFTAAENFPMVPYPKMQLQFIVRNKSKLHKENLRIGKKGKGSGNSVDINKKYF